MTKSELDSLDSIFLAPVCLIVNQAMGTIFPEVKILWACFVSFYFILFANINLDKGGGVLLFVNISYLISDQSLIQFTK